MTIKVKCVSSLDDFIREEWPTEMEARPEKGDLVRAKGGKELTVGVITHVAYKGQENIAGYGDLERHSFIEVRLVR